MQVIISPAKKMRIAADAFAPRGIPPFPEQTERVYRELRRIERDRGAEGLKELWRVNDKLLAENIEALHCFVPVPDETHLGDPEVAPRATPAVFSYVGLQYQSLAPDVLDLAALEWLQDHLWIISGLYGCARPFDAVEPYRLEMGAPLPIDGARDLYAFWGGRIARAIEDRRQAGRASKQSGPVVINLASVEYAKAVLPSLSPGTQIITCVFGEEIRRGKPVQRATASKIARGSMVRWMAERQIEDAADLPSFDIGYRHAPELSSTTGCKTTLVFMRK